MLYHPEVEVKNLSEANSRNVITSTNSCTVSAISETGDNKTKFVKVNNIVELDNLRAEKRDRSKKTKTTKYNKSGSLADKKTKSLNRDYQLHLILDVALQIIFCNPGLNLSTQNDVRVGLQWEDMLGKCSSKILHLFGLHWASNGVKWCKSEGIKDKLTPTLRYFWSAKVVKTM